MNPIIIGQLVHTLGNPIAYCSGEDAAISALSGAAVTSVGTALTTNIPAILVVGAGVVALFFLWRFLRRMLAGR